MSQVYYTGLHGLNNSLSTNHIHGVTGILSCFGMNKIINQATKAVKIRRDSNNDEQDIGFSGNNFDSATYNTFIGGGNGFGVMFYDQKNGHDLLQATAVTQPQVISDILDGDGTKTMKVTPGNKVPDLTVDFTVCFHMKSNVIHSALEYALDFSVSTNNLDFDFNDGPDGLRVYWNGTGANNIKAGATGDYTDGNTHFILVERNGTTIEVFIDGLSKGTNTLNTNFTVVGDLAIMSDYNGNLKFRGKVDNVHVYDRILTFGEKTTLKNFNPIP